MSSRRQTGSSCQASSIHTRRVPVTEPEPLGGVDVISGEEQDTDSGYPQRDDLYRCTLIGVSEALQMHGMKIVDQSIERRRVELFARHGNGQLKGLPFIAHIGGGLDLALGGCNIVGIKSRIGLGQERPKGRQSNVTIEQSLSTGMASCLLESLSSLE